MVTAAVRDCDEDGVNRPVGDVSGEKGEALMSSLERIFNCSFLLVSLVILFSWLSRCCAGGGMIHWV